MSDARSIDVLNRLLAIEYRSLPMYLRDAAPWVSPRDEKAAEVLRNITTDQRAMVERIGKLILDRGGTVTSGMYPMLYTDTHDLALDFLLRELVECQRRDVAAIERLVDEAGADREVRELVQETLGSQRAHLEALEELSAQPHNAA